MPERTRPNGHQELWRGRQCCRPEENFTGAGKVASHHHCRLSDGTRPNRQPATTAATAVTADGKHTARATSPMPSAGLTPPTPSGASTPSSSSHPLSNSTHHPRPDMRGIDHADPLQRHHPHHAHLPRHPTQDTTTATHQHTRQRQARATPQPLQAPKTCATRTPPPEATGAHLSALQPTPKPAHTPTADKPSAARTRTHSHTAATITTNHHTASHHDTPKPATTTKHQHTKTRRHELNHSSTNRTQRSDQRKHQTSRRRNNREPKTGTQTPQGVTAPTPFPDRFA